MSDEQTKQPPVDFLAREGEIETLTKLMNLEYQFEEESYVLSLNAEFGNGKTRFLELWQYYLEEECKNKKGKVNYVDSWKDSFVNDPLISLCYALSKALEAEEKSNEKKTKVVDVLKKFVGYSTIFGSQIIKQQFGIDAVEAQKILNEGSGKKLANTAAKEFRIFELKTNLIKELTEALENYVQELKTPLFIFIDELDRARPNYAIEFLETIRHIFTVKGLIFVLAIDKSQLESAIKPIYGNDIKFDGYFKKFITSSYDLKDIYQVDQYDSRKAELFITKYFQEYILKNNIKTCIQEINPRIKFIVSLVEVFKPSLRDLKYFFRIFVRYVTTDQNKKAYFGYVDIAAFLILLSIYDKEAGKPTYKKFSEGNLTLFQAEENLKSLNIDDKSLILIILCSVLCIYDYGVESEEKLKNKDFVGKKLYCNVDMNYDQLWTRANNVFGSIGSKKPIIKIAQDLESLKRLLN